MFVKALDGQAHDIVERSFDAVNADVPDPFLDPISARLVVGPKVFEVIVNLLIV